MSLRTSTALKFFAILIFSFELLAPAIVHAETPADSNANRSRSSITQTAHFSVISMLLMEENSSEEEKGNRDHRAVLSFTDLGFIVTFLQITDAEPKTTHWVPTHERFGSQPPLFTLHRTFLI